MDYQFFRACSSNWYQPVNEIHTFWLGAESSQSFQIKSTNSLYFFLDFGKNSVKNFHQKKRIPIVCNYFLIYRLQNGRHQVSFSKKIFLYLWFSLYNKTNKFGGIWNFENFKLQLPFGDSVELSGDFSFSWRYEFSTIQLIQLDSQK